MNDSPTSEDETPEIAEVRRLLADARHSEPMPDHVSARMDRLIAGLADGGPAASPEPPDGGTVIPIAPQRRRRAAALLVAAAAIVVGGVAAGQLVHGSSSPGSAADAPESQAFDSGATGDQSLGPNTSSTAKSPEHPRLRHGRLVVRPRYFTYDALEGRRLLSAHKQAMATDRLTVQDCGRLTGRARALAAEYQDAPAALLYRRPQGGSQIVNLFVCGSSRPIRTTTLPAP